MNEFYLFECSSLLEVIDIHSDIKGSNGSFVSDEGLENQLCELKLDLF
jgi:hypothetical protein